MARSRHKGLRYFGVLVLAVWSGNAAPPENAAAFSPPGPPAAESSALPILRALPDSAAFGLAFPPLPGLCEQLAALAARFPAGPELVARFNTLLESTFRDEGMHGFRDLASFLTSKGLAPDSPSGVFVDLTLTVADAEEAGRKFAQAVQDQVLAPAMSYHPPAVLALFGVSDPEMAEASVRETLLRIGGNSTDVFEEPRPTTGKASGLHWLREGLAYSVNNQWLYITNSEALFNAVVARQAQPAEMRHGAAEDSASTPGDTVLLTRLDKVTSRALDLLSVVHYTGQVYPTLQWPVASAEGRRQFLDFYAPETGPDPVVTTISITPERVELVSRVELGKHPGLARADIAPARPGLSRHIPSGGLLSCFVNWGDSLNAAAVGCSELLPVELREQYWREIRRALDTFARGQTAFGVRPGTPPAVTLFLEVSDGVGAAGLMGQYLDEIRGEELGGDTWHLGVGSLDLFVQLEGGVLVATNRKEQLPAMRESVRSQGGQAFFETLDPPVRGGDIISVLSLDTACPADLATLLAAFGFVSDAASQAAVAEWLGPIREIRSGKTIEYPWQTQFLTLYLSP